MKNSSLIRATNWIDNLNLPFIMSMFSMTFMLLWAGSYKLTMPGAEGIIPLVANSPLISWDFTVFGTYVGSDLIGVTEIAAAILMLVGLYHPKAGIVGTLIAMVMFITTSTMILTTPGTIVMVKGMGYMTFLGLFLFKDVVGLAVALHLVSHFRYKAIRLATQN